MVLNALKGTDAALDAIKAFTGAKAALGAIEQDKNLTLTLEATAPSSAQLRDVQGWTYLHLFRDDPDEPYATIAGQIDPGNLANWARDLVTAEITIWMNSTLINAQDTTQAQRQGKMIAIAVHEWELHARALYDFYSELRGAQSGKENALRDLKIFVTRGVYSASEQHHAPELRSAQMLTIFRLACKKVTDAMPSIVGSKRKAPVKAELDISSVEYAALMTTRGDVLDEASGLSLAAAKEAYAGSLGALKTTYGADVVAEVIDQFVSD